MMAAGVDKTGKIVSAALLVVTAVLFVLVVALPGQQAAKQSASYGRAVGALSSIEGQVSNIEAEVNTIEDALAAAADLLPEGISVDDFVDRVGEAAKEAGVRIESVVPGEMTEDLLFRSLRLQLRAAGTYPELHRFFGALESMPQLTRVVRVQIAQTGELSTAQITLALYYSRERGR